MSFRRTIRVRRGKSVRLIDSQESTTNVCVLSAESPGNVLGFNGEWCGMPRNVRISADTFGITPCYAYSMWKFWWIWNWSLIQFMSSQYGRLLNSMLWLTTKKTSKVPVTGPLRWESPSDWWISHTRCQCIMENFLCRDITSHQEAMKINTND